MRVMALPARANRANNSYNAQLYDHLECHGFVVEEASLRNIIFKKYDIFHVHWPQEPANKSFLIAMRRTALLLIFLVINRLNGGKNVWTVHNVLSHEQKRPNFERRLMSRVTKLLDGFITLNAHALVETQTKWPWLRERLSVVIPHALYEQAFPIAPDRHEARRRFGITSLSPIIGFIGDLKPYKGLSQAIDSFLSISSAKATMFIAGKVQSSADHAFIIENIIKANYSNKEIILKEGRLSDHDLVTAIRACDLILFPYKSKSNSGLAILTAELGVPMLLADTPAFRELVEEIKSPVIKISENDFSPNELIDSAIAAQIVGHKNPNKEFIYRRSQKHVAELTAVFLRSLHISCSDKCHPERG